MKIDQLISELERDEALKLKPYRDSKGILTIGIGRNLEANGISRDEAYMMVHNDIERVIADLNTRLPWWEKLDDVRQRVLANMCFNMGIGRLMGFAKMLSAIECGDFETAATEMLDSKWQADVGVRAIRLSDMMRTGLTADLDVG